MAREILLRLKTQNYERAKKVAERIAERAKTTLKTAKALTGELKLSVERAQKAAELRARTASLGERGARASRRDLQAMDRQRFGNAIGRASEVGDFMEQGIGLFDAAVNGNVSQQVSGMLGFAQFLPGIGPFMAAAAPVIERLFSQFEERHKAELRKFEIEFTSRMEEEAFKADFSRRFQEDPRFRREQSRLAFLHQLQEEQVRGKRVQRTAADLLSDFEL